MGESEKGSENDFGLRILPRNFSGVDHPRGL